MKTESTIFFHRRHYVLLIFLLLLFGGILVRIGYLQLKNNVFLQQQADARSVRAQHISTYRGDILDRNGKPLAISAEVYDWFIDASQFKRKPRALQALALVSGINPSYLRRMLVKNEHSKYVRIQSNLTPAAAQQLQALNITGVHVSKKYQRFYPTQEAAAQLIGLTDKGFDGTGSDSSNGISGLEKTFNEALRAKSGKKMVLINGHGEVIRELGVVYRAIPGNSVRSSIDVRIQDFTFQSIKRMVVRSKATAASMIILKIDTGEALAVANYPSYNPNYRKFIDYTRTRNAVFVDLFEPGSTMKAFTVAIALHHGHNIHDLINTGNGRMKLGPYTIHDASANGIISIEHILTKSSNVGAVRLGLELGGKRLATALSKYGFNHNSGSMFPGEPSSMLPTELTNTVNIGALSYGYGLTTSVANLARAYAIFGRGGYDIPISLIKINTPHQKIKVMSPSVANAVLTALKKVTQPGGTGTSAAIPGYQVAGKTGTTHKVVDGKYRYNYRSTFVGIVPADNPIFVAVVSIDEPNGNTYYGGEVAAPVFAEVMNKALKIFRVYPAI